MSASLAQFPRQPEETSAGPRCMDDPYPRYKPGVYEVLCLRAVSYRDPRFGRHLCRLDCQLLATQEPICCFLNLGNLKQPVAGRGSDYRRVWILANDDVQPKKRQVLSDRIFKGKIFKVSVDDTVKRYDGLDHPRCEVYSTIKDVIAKVGP